MKSQCAGLAGGVLVLAATLGLCASTQVPAVRKPPLVMSSMYGPDFFAFYCVSCHGRDGKGNGPASSSLRIRPPDLATLSRRNGGLFPSRRVQSALLGGGPRPSDAHGSTEMPVRGRIFRTLDPDARRGAVRLASLVAYVESIQATAPEPRLWVDPSGRATPEAREALAVLAHAGEEGLDPADYDGADLERAAISLETATASPAQIPEFDRRLTASLVRYVHDVHEGRVTDPRTLGYRVIASPDHHDFEAIVRKAVADHRVAAMARELAPPLALYRHLRGALARYRVLSADPTLEPLSPGAIVHPGERYVGAGPLWHRLAALEDLPAGSSEAGSSSFYTGPIVDGVRHFQRRHGLDVDGVLGRETQAALNVPLAWRVRQIELALERLRWLPHLEDERFVAVNIPMFRLWAWDGVRADGTASFQTGVIVGRAFNTRTPVFVEEMRDIVFRPYWNVPSSIVRHEIIPALRRNRDYLRDHNMEIVSAPGAPLRLRQRPGPSNALGLVKFVFPNDDNVYMHGTPAPALFARARRDFSHGCVRVEDPVGLAEWALAGQPAWPRERILVAMNGAASLRVQLARPIRVILFYITAVITPEDGAIHFAEDIYGHDARLHQMLTRKTA